MKSFQLNQEKEKKNQFGGFEQVREPATLHL